MADGVHSLIPDVSNTYVVQVVKGRYHKTETRGGVAFEVEVEVEFEVEVGGQRSYANYRLPPPPYCCELNTALLWRRR